MKLKKLGLFRKIPNRFFVTKAKESDTKITIDSELSLTSENPVQNKVITEALENAGKKLYQHFIDATLYVRISGETIFYYIGFSFIDENSSPYIKQTFAKILYDGGYTSRDKKCLFGMFRDYSVVTPSTSNIYVLRVSFNGFFASSETTLKMHASNIRRMTLDINSDNQVIKNTYAELSLDTDLDCYDFTDTVFEI